MSTQMALGDPGRTRVVHRVAAVVAILVVSSALRIVGIHRVRRVLGWVASRLEKEAHPELALRSLAAIDVTAGWLPIRVACLERSLSAIALLAMRGRSLTWCLGVRTPPFAMHAWLCDRTGRPIGEPADTRFYQPIITVPSSEYRNVRKAA